MLLRIRWRSQVVDKLNDLSVDWIALPELFVAHSIVELIFRLFFIAVKRSSFPVEVRLAYACRHSPTVWAVIEIWPRKAHKWLLDLQLLSLIFTDYDLKPLNKLKLMIKGTWLLCAASLKQSWVSVLDFTDKLLEVLIFHFVRQRVEERDHVFWVSFNVAKPWINLAKALKAFIWKPWENFIKLAFLVNLTIFTYRLLFVGTKVVVEKIVLNTLLHDFFDQLLIHLLKSNNSC